MKFLDQQLLIDVIQDELKSSQLTFKVIDSNILNFSVQLPFYLNPPQELNQKGLNSQIDDLELSNKVSFD
jgi:hypothetical protein